MEIELNSFETNASNRQCGVQFDSSPSLLVINSLNHALDRLAKASSDRCIAIRTIAATTAGQPAALVDEEEAATPVSVVLSEVNR